MKHQKDSFNFTGPLAFVFGKK